MTTWGTAAAQRIWREECSKGAGRAVGRKCSGSFLQGCVGATSGRAYRLSERCQHVSAYDGRPRAGFKLREVVHQFAQHFMFMFSFYLSLTHTEQEQMKGFKARLFIMD